MQQCKNTKCKKIKYHNIIKTKYKNKIQEITINNIIYQRIEEIRIQNTKTKLFFFLKKTSYKHKIYKNTEYKI